MVGRTIHNTTHKGCLPLCDNNREVTFSSDHKDRLKKYLEDVKQKYQNRPPIEFLVNEIMDNIESPNVEIHTIGNMQDILFTCYRNSAKRYPRSKAEINAVSKEILNKCCEIIGVSKENIADGKTI